MLKKSNQLPEVTQWAVADSGFEPTTAWFTSLAFTQIHINANRKEVRPPPFLLAFRLALSTR